MATFKEIKVDFPAGITKVNISTKIPSVVELEDVAAPTSKTLSLKSVLFSKDSLDKLLSASDCKGIRFFPVLYDVENESGVVETNRLTFMAVGVADDDEKLTGNTIYISERPCPPFCPKLVIDSTILEVKQKSS